MHAMNMAKATTFAVFLLLQLISSTATAPPLRAACRKTAYATFCITMLQPYASELRNKDKFGSAAISATLARAEAAKTLITRQQTNTQLTADQRAALRGCLDNVGYSVSALQNAAEEFESMREATSTSKRTYHLKKSTLRLTISNNDQNACYESLNDIVGGEIIRNVRLRVDEAAKAGIVAKSLIQKMN